MPVLLQPMPGDRLGAWIATSNAEYVQARLVAGETRAEAEAAAALTLSQLFPGGEPLSSHRVFDVVENDDIVGYLWIGPKAEGNPEWWVWDIEILEGYRRRGFARAALTMGIAEAGRLGATSIGLNVFGYNTGARQLYESLGFEVTATQMRKSLQ